VGYHTAYEQLTDLYWNPPLSGFSRLYMKALNRLLFSTSDVVIANSTEMIQKAKTDGAHTVEMIGTPIAKSFLCRPTRPIASPPESLCYCGRLTPEKNIPKILKAAKEMPAKKFTFAGDGPLREEVAAAAKTHMNIHYVGWVSREEVRAVIDAADIMLLPSVVEAFGTIALEAMSRQKLVLVAEGCGIVNWPQLNSGICVMQVGESLSQAIERICASDGEDRRQKAQLAYHAAQSFNAVTIKQWTRLFRRIHRTGPPN
jgi:glycosyltransferase involved in cell wall biosynthesis